MLLEMEIETTDHEQEYQDGEGVTVAELLVALKRMLASGDTGLHSAVQLHSRYIGDAVSVVRCTGDGTVILGSSS